MDDPFAGLFGSSSSQSSQSQNDATPQHDFFFNSSPIQPQGNQSNQMIPTNDFDPNHFQQQSNTTSDNDLSIFSSGSGSFTSVNSTNNVESNQTENNQTRSNNNVDDMFSIFSSSSSSQSQNQQSFDPFGEFMNSNEKQQLQTTKTSSTPPTKTEIPQSNTSNNETSQMSRKSESNTNTEKNESLDAGLSNEYHDEESETDLGEAENEDIFEQTYDAAKALELKLKEKKIFHQVENEIQHLLHVLQLLETQVQERDEDSRQLLTAFQNVKERGPAPQPPPMEPGRITEIDVGFDLSAFGTQPQPQPQTHQQRQMDEYQFHGMDNSHSHYTEDDIRRIVKMQRLWRKTKGQLISRKLPDIVLFYKSHPDEDAKQRILWHKTIRELIKTEQIYQRKLYLLIHCFMVPLDKKIKLAQQKQANTASSTAMLPSGLSNFSNSIMNSANECKIATPHQFKQIFMNIQDIYAANEIFLKKLQLLYENWPQRQMPISALFAQGIIPHFQLYVEYMKSYQTHLKIIAQLHKHNRHFVNWIRIVQRNHFSELTSKQGNNVILKTIPDLSIAPIHQCFHYFHILEKLISYGPSRPDLEQLRTVQLQFKNFIHQTNDLRKINENMKNIFLKQNKIIGNDVPDLMEPHRFFVRDGAILTLTDRIHRRFLFVFNDLLIVTKKTWKPGSDDQVFESSIPLRDAVVTDDMEVPFSFRICYEKAQKFMSFVCHSDEEKARWMRDITNALADSVSHLQPTQFDKNREKTSMVQRTLSKQGYLSKMEGGFIKTWKTRWIQIASSVLFSFASESDTVPLRSYHLKVCCVFYFFSLLIKFLI